MRAKALKAKEVTKGEGYEKQDIEVVLLKNLGTLKQFLYLVTN